MSYDLVVIGGGLAGRTAALRAASAGWRVGVADAALGGTAFWSGAGDVLGPTSTPRATQGPHDFGAPPSPAVENLDDDARLAGLARLAPAHPYLIRGWGAADVRRRCAEALELVALPATLHASPVALATFAGTTRYADIIAEGVALPVQEVSVCCVGVEALAQISAEWTAKAALRLGARAEAAWVDTGHPPLATLARANALDLSPALAERGAPMRADAYWLPPLLGTDLVRARARREAVEAAWGAPVRELVGAPDAPFGLRALTHLRARCSAQGVDALPGVTAPPTCAGGVWSAEDGGWSARSLVLALGGHIGRGRRASWAEAWLSKGPHPPEHAARSPWNAQPFSARGAQTTETGLVLVDGQALDGVWAAGAVLDGHDPSHDGTALGVALTTGVAAAEAAMEARA